MAEIESTEKSQRQFGFRKTATPVLELSEQNQKFMQKEMGHLSPFNTENAFNSTSHNLIIHEFKRKYI